MFINIFERIIGCIAAALVIWSSLQLLFTSNDSTAVTNAAVYAATALAAIVFLALLFLYVVPLIFLRLLALYLTPADAKELALFSHEIEQWEPTTVSVLESYKTQLREIEERARYLELSAQRVRSLNQEDSGALVLWIAERGLSILRKQCWKESGTAQSLKQTISRIHSGDINHEILNFQEQIADLQSQKNYRDTDTITEWVNDGIDRKIRAAQRNITELQTWSNKVTAANPVSPYEESWQTFLDYVRRTAAAPLVEATYRVQATFAGIELKHRFEQIATEEWRRGRLTDEELAYIKNRIRDQFLHETRNSYA